MTTYDVIVIGVGGVGSSTVYHLARQNLRVLGIEQFSLGHRRGSSHGQTRIIRQAYFEHPAYVPLLIEAYRLWNELETATGRQLLYQVGLVEVGPPEGIVLPGIRKSASQHELMIEEISRRSFATRFPGLSLPAGHEAIFEPTAGYLCVEQCVLAHIDEAARLGADFRSNETVLNWLPMGGSYRLQTTRGQYSANRLIFCGGAWTSRLVRDLNFPLKVVRKHTYWFSDNDQCYQASEGSPGFFYETDAGYYYGLPSVDRLGVKLAQHDGGSAVHDPDKISTSMSRPTRRRIERFVNAHLPRLGLEPTNYETCLYTLTPDEHFVLDWHPTSPGIVVIGGLSGHGFKFTSVLGNIAADLVVEGQSAPPIDLFRLSR